MCAYFHLQEPLLTTGTHPKTLRVNGVDLHYIEQGEGEAVLFVHGGLGDYRTWRPQMHAFSERYRAVSYSRRGFYPNHWPEGYSVASMQLHVDDMAALIEQLELAPVHIVANSYGGYVSLLLAMQHPATVRSLSLAEPPVHPMLRKAPGGEAMFEDFMVKAWWPARAAFAAGDLEGGVRSFLNGAVGPGAFEEMHTRVREAMMKNAPELGVCTLTDYLVYMPHVTCEQVGTIQAPVLLMSGERSPRMYYLINDALAGCLPDAEQATIHDASHVLNTHNPEAHNRIVLDFLARHDAG